MERGLKLKTYTELSQLCTFSERYVYLQLNGVVGEETFGFDRFLNQSFYNSREWKKVRDLVIVRDHGYDLGIDGYGIGSKIIIHHMNPIRPKDIETHLDLLLDPEYLITTTHPTHRAIHYGDESLLVQVPIERSKNDTCPWRRN